MVIFHTTCFCLFCRGIYEVKWFIQLADLVLNDKMDDTLVEWKQKIEKAEKEIKAMKVKVKELKAALRKEIKECREVSHHDIFVYCCCYISVTGTE